MKTNPFHLAIPVANLQTCRTFYGEVLGFEEGRSSTQWVDFNFFGHQLVLHEKEGLDFSQQAASNSVDGHDVPVPHFGVVLDWDDWHNFSERLKEEGIQFAIEPYIRFKGEPGEQATLFFYDPENNALEFKAFKNMQALFSK